LEISGSILTDQKIPNNNALLAENLRGTEAKQFFGRNFLAENVLA